MGERAIAEQHQRQGLRYRRLLQLGHGGMATVHLALATGQNDFSRLVVVKTVRESQASVEEVRRMFLSEARLSARLNHPNVVQVSEVVESDQDVMLVMEYLDGQSLAEAYTSVPREFTLPLRLRVLCEVLRGLHYAHELTDYDGAPLGIVHRDVSPQNVYLTYDGRIKLLDFGIAKATNSGVSNETQQGVVKGRVAYMPVEQFTGDGTDRRADVYAVGCMLWEAISGARMWGNSTDVEILKQVWSGNIPMLDKRLKVDEDLRRIVQKATAHDAEDRYATAEAFRLELEAHLENCPTATSRAVGEMLSDACADKRLERQRLIAEAIARSKRESVSQSLYSIVKRVVPPQAASSSAPPPVERRRWLWMPIAAAVLLGIAVTAVALQLKPPQVAPPTTARATAEPMHDLTIQPVPEDALVFVDDEPLTGEPPMLKVARGSQHTVRVQREGYRTDKRRLYIDADTMLRVELDKQPEADIQPPAAPAVSLEQPSKVRSAPVRAIARPRVSAAQRPAATAKPNAAAPGNTANCSPPYYFEAGIKTFKPECI